MWESIVRGGSLGTPMGHGDGGATMGGNVGCLGSRAKRGEDLAFGSFGGLFYFGVRCGFPFLTYVVDSVCCLIP